MIVASLQNEVFNRTSRIEIPFSCIRRAVGPGVISFDGLREGEWSQSLNAEELKACVIHVDIRSVLLWERTTIDRPEEAFKKDWQSCRIKVPVELTNNDFRVKMQVTVSFPSGHKQAGRILARSSEIIIVEGPQGSTGAIGASLLPVRPALDNIPELWRLVIEDSGPVVEINRNVPGMSWKALASEARFKLAIFPECVRKVLRELVLKPGYRSTWGVRWMELDGIRGRDIPAIDELDLLDGWDELNTFVEEACEGLLTQSQLADRLGKSLEASEN